MYIYDNFFCRDVMRKTRYIGQNLRIDKINKQITKLDSIKNYIEFKEYVVKNIKNRPIKTILMKNEIGGEGLFYGQRKAFFDYAGMSDCNMRFILPYFEHSADLKELVLQSVFERPNHSFVYQATYKNEMVHKYRPFSPVYNIGPYILYANKYYDDEEMKSLKKKMGKTVLLFPAHSFEGGVLEFDKEKFVKDVMSGFKDQFDTIMVCVYWNDVDDPIYDLFEAEGAKLVSAGFRGDQNFVVRLRTLIELADEVASNLIGSYIGYSLALKKPFFMFGSRAKIFEAAKVGTLEEQRRYGQTMNDVYEAFSSRYPTVEQKNKQIELYKRFWGGEENFKSIDQARLIISLSMKLLKASGGTSKGFEKAVQLASGGQEMNYYEKQELVLLRQSLGMDI